MMALELGCHPESSSWLLLDLGDLGSIETVVETVQDSGSVSFSVLDTRFSPVPSSCSFPYLFQRVSGFFHS